MENMRKNRDIKLVTKERRRNYLVSEPLYPTTTMKFFMEKSLAIEMYSDINKPVYLGLTLGLSKTVMYEFWYDYIKPKYGENAKLYTDSFIVHVKADDIYKDSTKDVGKRFDTLNYEIGRPVPKGRNKKLIGLMEDELGGQILREFVGLRAKTYSYLSEKHDEDKKVKGTKKCVIKRKLKFKDHNNCLRTSQIQNIINYLKKKEIDVDCLKKEFIQKRCTLKTQQRF